MVFALGESPQGVNVRRLQFGRPAPGGPRSNSDDQRDTSERHGRFVSVSMASVVNPRWSGPSGVVCPRADPLPSRGAGDLQQGQGRFVVSKFSVTTGSTMPMSHSCDISNDG